MSTTEPECVEVGGALIEKNQLSNLLKNGSRRRVKKMTENANTDFLNEFEILAPPKRTAKILGEEIDLSVTPAKVSFSVIKFSKKHDIKKLESMTEETFDPQMITDLLELICQIWKEKNPTVTPDWLLSNLGITDLMKFVQFVFAGIVQKKTADKGSKEGGSDGKN